MENALAAIDVVKTNKVNILLVDDQPAKLLSYEVILGSLGERLIKAGSAREALEFLLKNDVAVMLIDVNMPELDGFELAEIIREHPRYQKTAIIFVSAVHLSDLDRLKGYQRGAVDYVSVPIVPEILRAKVSVFADLYRKTRELELLNSELEQRVEERTAKLRESEAQFRAMFDMAAVGQALLDSMTGRFVQVNQRFCEITGYEADELFGMMAEDLIHPDERDREMTFSISAISSDSDEYMGENRYIRKDGEVIWVNIAARLIRDDRNQPLRAICAIKDITAQKRSEQERERMLLRERRSRRQIEEISRLKDEFIATISHELRTPLTAMLGWVRLLRDGKLDVIGKERAMEIIERNAKAQNLLIEDLLDMSRIISGKLDLDIQSIDLASVIEAVVNSVSPTADLKEISLQMSLLPVGLVEGDYGRMQQVIWNLLSNAVKFTPRGGRVLVRLEQIESQALISVCDNGQGISPDFLPYIFDRFRQADASITRNVGGLGLGLAIARHLVELHGGSIEAESEGLGKGATFRLKLFLKVGKLIPMTEEEQLTLSEKNTILGYQVSLKGVKVLVVEDEADTRDMMEVILKQYESEVVTAKSVSQALEIFNQWTPNVLISDIAMPETDGYELMQIIRKLPPDQGGLVPALALTAHAKSEDRLRALSAGFNMHLSKPIEPMELIAVVANLSNLPTTLKPPV